MSLPIVVAAVLLIIRLLPRRSFATAVQLVAVTMLVAACAPSDGSSAGLPPLTNPPGPATFPESSGAADTTTTTPAFLIGDSVPATTPTTTNAQAGRQPSSITFAQPPDRTMVTPRFTLKASATSKLTVVFTTSTPLVCTTGGSNGNAATLLGVGVCTITADQPGNSLYAPAASVTQSFTVALADQVITFTAVADRTLNTPSFSVTARSSSHLPVTVASTTPTVCSVGGAVGRTVTLLAAGVCQLTAAQSGDSAYNAAASVTVSFNVALLSQVITFAPIADRSLYSSDFHVVAKASSNLPVTVTSMTPDVCTVGGTSGRTVSLVAAGTCTLHADQAGSGAFDQAPTAVATFAVIAP